jgi:hypothetical protein
MNRVCAAQGVRSGFRQTDAAHLAFFDELLHRADGLFNRRRRVNTMLVVKVNHVHTEAAQARFARRADIFGLAADAAYAFVRFVSDDAKLRGNQHLFAPTAYRAPYQFFIRKRAVHVSRIQKVDA